MPNDALVYARPLLEEEEFQAIIDHLPFPFAYLDQNLRFVLVNRACAESLGRAKEEFLGRIGLELFGRKRRMRSMAQEDDGEEKDEDEAEPWPKNRRKRGAWRLTALRNEDGRVRGYLLSRFPLNKESTCPYDLPGLLFETLTTGKIPWLETFFANPAQSFLILDRSGVVRRTNRSAVAALGFDPVSLTVEEIGRRVAFRRLNGAVLRSEELPFARVLLGETVAGEIFILTNARGRSLPVLVSAAPIVGEEDILGAIVSWYALGDLRQLQEAQGDYLRIISHDLRQPLTVIAAQAQLIERAAERPDRVRRGAQAIYATVWRMNALIQDLVDAAHFEAGQLRLKIKEIELPTYLYDLLERLECAMNTERIVVLPASDLPRVAADPDRLERIFVNLLTNALKYSESESPVTVSFRPEAARVVVAISDRGRGIDPEDLPHLFARYYRSPAVRDHAEGLGLGLYITKVLVEAHGGQIWVESVREVGSTFYFTLPAACAGFPLRAVKEGG
ncbi:MAG: ATP-binding protein [Bacillota bacterium]